MAYKGLSERSVGIMEDKEKIIIDGVDVSQCEFYIYYSSDRYPHRCGMHKDMFGMPACCDVADCCKNCYFKQLQKEKFENLNNRQRPHRRRKTNQTY